MNNKKENKDVTLWVSIVMALALFFPIYGPMLTSCVKTEATTTDESAEYWHQKYLSAQEELMLWRDICHMYYQFKDYEDLDENWEPVRRYTFWEDAIMDTPTFDKLDSIQQGDWEDFYAEW